MFGADSMRKWTASWYVLLHCIWFTAMRVEATRGTEHKSNDQLLKSDQWIFLQDQYMFSKICISSSFPQQLSTWHRGSLDTTWTLLLHHGYWSPQSSSPFQPWPSRKINIRAGRIGGQPSHWELYCLPMSRNPLSLWRRRHCALFMAFQVSCFCFTAFIVLSFVLLEGSLMVEWSKNYGYVFSVSRFTNRTVSSVSDLQNLADRHKGCYLWSRVNQGTSLCL